MTHDKVDFISERERAKRYDEATLDVGEVAFEAVNGRETVSCDEKCGAFMEPETPEEFKAAAVHWQKHSLMYGCSHGC